MRDILKVFKRPLHLMLITIVIIIIVSSYSIWAFLNSSQQNKENKRWYLIIYDGSDKAFFERTIKLKEGETYEQEFELKPMILEIGVSVYYEEDRPYSNDAFEIRLIPPDGYENLSGDDLYYLYCQDTYIREERYFEIMSVLQPFKVYASSEKEALDKFYKTYDVDYGSGTWKLVVNYIGDGPLNLDRGGEIYIRLTCERIYNFRAIEYKEIKLGPLP